MGQYTEAVQKLYVAYFNRPADVGGLTFWESVVASKNGDTSAVSSFFSTSPEYVAAYQNKSSLETVATIYQNLFGREAEPAGLLYWALKLDKGDLTIANVVTEISRNAVGTDLDAYNSKVAASTVFSNAMDTTAEILAYGNKDAQALAKAFLTGVTNAATQAAAEAAIDTTIANLVAAADAVNNKGQTYTLTTGIDSGANFTGGKGNDSFVSNATTGATFTSFDVLDGGAGTDSFSVVSAQGTPLTIPSTATVKNIESATLTSDNTITADVSGWTGLTSLTVASVGEMDIDLAATTAAILNAGKHGAGTVTVDGGSSVTLTTVGATTGAITVGGVSKPTGDITISRTTTGAANAGTITVMGGSKVVVNQLASNTAGTTQDNGTVNVTGGASTSSVTVNNPAAATASETVAGINLRSVNITDVNNGSKTDAGKITTVTVNNASSVTIKDNALTTLSVKGVAGDISIQNSGLTTPTNKTLALTLDGQGGGTLSDAGVYTTVNVTATGSNSKLDDIQFSAATKLNLAGTKSLTLTANTALGSVTDVVVSGSAGLTADLSGLGKLAAINTSATTGSTTISSYDATKATYTGGAGVDKVTTAGAVSKAISLGGGDDSLVLNGASTAAIDGGAGTDGLTISAASAATASADSKFAGLVTNFERLTLTGSTNQTIDLDVLGKFNHVTTSGGNGLTLGNMPTGGTLVLNDSGIAYTITNSAFSGAANDVLNLSLTEASGGNIGFGSITAAKVESFVISNTDTQDTAAGVNSLTVVGNDAKSITVSGNTTLNLSALSTAATTVDASGLTKGDFTWTSGALAAASTVKGSATGTNTITATAATAAVSYTGGSGNDVVTINNAKNNVLNLGDGTNTFTGGDGVNEVNSGKGADTITVGHGNNKLSLGDGNNVVTAGNGKNTITTGAGDDTITVGSGLNTITTGTGTDTVELSAVGANVNVYNTITDAHKGLQLKFQGVDGDEIFADTQISLATTAVFQDYANAVVQAGGAQGNSGYFGWFVFDGNTYIVESRHNGATTPSFVNGTDMVVKLTGVVDVAALQLVFIPDIH